jgi:hypothetical protein
MFGMKKQLTKVTYVSDAKRRITLKSYLRSKCFVDKQKTELSHDNSVWFAKLKPTGLVLRHWHHVGGLQTLGTFLDGKFHFLLSLELAVAIGLNGAKMYKHIFTIIAANKAVALGGIEPLDSSNKTFAHLTYLLLVKNFMPIHLYAFEGETGTTPARLSCL